MKALLIKIWNKIKTFFIEDYYDDSEPVPLYLAVNGVYMQWIESIERQVEQTKIDLAIGSIDKKTYDRKFEEFQKEVKKLSSAYAKELLSYSV